MSDTAVSSRKEAIKAKMDEKRRQLIEAIEAITPEQRSLPTNNEGWTVWDVAVHIAAAEGGMQPIAQRIMEKTPNQKELFAGFDVDLYNESGLKKRRHLEKAELLQMLADSRARMYALLDDAKDSDLDLPGYHPVAGDVTLQKLFEIIAWHEGLHAKEIKQSLVSSH